MKRGYVICLLAVGALALAGGQEDLLPRLSEDIVRKIMPVIRVDAANATAALGLVQEMTAKMEAYTQLVADIGAGKVDPLAWLRSKSKYVIVPPSAVYKPKLSSWASSNYFQEPLALFSFGIEAPREIQKGAINGQVMGKLVLSGDAIYKLPGGQKLKAVEDETIKFYEANKFVPSHLQRFFSFIAKAPDASVAIDFEYTNMFAGAEVGEGVPNGPLLWVWLSSGDIFDNPREDISKPRDKSARAPENMDAALAKAGMNREAYQLYLGALVMAKSDAADPSTLEISADITGLSAEQAKAIKDMQDFYALRKSNLKIYQKFAVQLDPLLALLGK